jgi:hypothetical protein
MTRALTTFALAGGLAAASSAVAVAAPSYDLNPAGHGISSLMLTCDGTDLTVLINNNASQTGGWGAARVVGGGVLVPTALTFSTVDLTTGVVVHTETQLKGGGHPSAGTTTCTLAVQDTGATFADLIASGDINASDLPAGVALTDEVGFSLSATVIPHG